ncbi:ribosomal-protein-alanine N-acetyltransferase [Pseudoalteromonas citrea]|uniref:Ribosomal-protein-alanine N-acetyltransferase n=2 Tax=Pseudoalteromonas citrea TaxID=43655 RepID=A0AAD4AIY9_9GAMM|nr:GNAT family N-acetyltransferase [Pseudoalteromonas citrea]KAF7771491.1 ribosomal-protein-alanine N-acetyltransferase [Pseudoalteromonas citrea]
MDLESTRLLLRPISYRDTDVLMTVLNDPLVAQYNDYGMCLSRDEIKALIQWDLEQMYRGVGMRYAMLLKPCNTFVGTLGIYDHDTLNNTCHIGFELSSMYWGRGLMYEALDCLVQNMRYGNTLFHGNLVISAKVARNNTRCAQLLKRLQFHLIDSKTADKSEHHHYQLTLTCNNLTFA